MGAGGDASLRRASPASSPLCLPLFVNCSKDTRNMPMEACWAKWLGAMKCEALLLRLSFLHATPLSRKTAATARLFNLGKVRLVRSCWRSGYFVSFAVASIAVGPVVFFTKWFLPDWFSHFLATWFCQGWCLLQAAPAYATLRVLHARAAHDLVADVHAELHLSCAGCVHACFCLLWKAKCFTLLSVLPQVAPTWPAPCLIYWDISIMTTKPPFWRC